MYEHPFISVRLPLGGGEPNGKLGEVPGSEFVIPADLILLAIEDVTERLQVALWELAAHSRIVATLASS